MLVYCGNYKGRYMIKDTDDNALEFFTKTDIKRAFKSIPNLQIIGCKYQDNILNLHPMPTKVFNISSPFLTIDKGVITYINFNSYDPVKDGDDLHIRLSKYGWKLDVYISDYYLRNKKGRVVLHLDDNLIIGNYKGLCSYYSDNLKFDISEVSDPQILYKLLDVGFKNFSGSLIDPNRASQFAYFDLLGKLRGRDIDITECKNIQSITKYEDAITVYKNFSNLLIDSMKLGMYDDYTIRDVKLIQCASRSALSLDTISVIYKSNDTFFSNYVRVYGDAIPTELKELYVNQLTAYLNEHQVYPDKAVLMSGNNKGFLGYKSSIGRSTQFRFEILAGFKLEIDDDILRAIIITSNEIQGGQIWLSKYCKYIDSHVLRIASNVNVHNKTNIGFQTLFVLDDLLTVDKDAFNIVFPSGIGLDISNFHDETVVNCLYANSHSRSHLVDSDERFIKTYLVKYLSTLRAKRIHLDLSPKQIELIDKYVVTNESRLIDNLEKISEKLDNDVFNLQDNKFKYGKLNIADVGQNFFNDKKLISGRGISRGINICLNIYYYFHSSQNFKDKYYEVMHKLYIKFCKMNHISY